VGPPSAAGGAAAAAARRGKQSARRGRFSKTNCPSGGRFKVSRPIAETTLDAGGANAIFHSPRPIVRPRKPLENGNMVGHRIGSVSSGTLAPSELANEFYFECDGRGGHVEWPDVNVRNSWWNRFGEIGDRLFPNDDGSMTDDSEIVSESVDELSELLNEIAPPYTYFGAHCGDGADFGFWPDFESIDEMPKFDDFPDTLPGQDFVVVNDHGNMTIYSAAGEMLWDCI
jgi:hypothetical protein